MEGSTSSRLGRGMEPFDNDEGAADRFAPPVRSHEEQAILGQQRDEIYEYAGETFYHIWFYHILA